MQNQSLQHHLQGFGDFDQLNSAEEVNQRLAAAGYDLSHIKGNYPPPPPPPQPGSLQAQGSQ